MKIYVTDQPMPASADVLAAGEGCEIHHVREGDVWPRRLQELGIDTLGLHELPDPEPAPVPEPLEPLDEMLAAGTITEREAEIIRALRG